MTDVVCAGLGLLLLSPLLILTALLIKIEDPKGGVFFGQERSGLYGLTFKMWKFRSMVSNAEELREKLEAENEMDGPVFKIKNDPRITRVGRFLRKSSIDELPQLWNVLTGDMSLVGPRPPIPAEVEKYERWQMRRLSMRPGITCIWQVSGRNNIDFDTWMKLDLQYIDNWTLFLDLKLLLKTLPVVLLRRGAS
jgi:exopolysaccharide biosynthesis polyprenyl glycosylphosphotransferase